MNFERPKDTAETYRKMVLMQKHIDDLTCALNIASEHLIDAANSISSWGAYADKYFQDKHGLDFDVEECIDYAKRAKASLDT